MISGNMPLTGHVVAPKTKVKPRGYQAEGIEFLQRSERAMLRDNVGLGKTIQAALAAKPPVLVMVPNILVGQWHEWLRGEDEISMKLNGGRVIPNVEGNIEMCKGNYYQKMDTLSMLRKGTAQWVVGNHQMLYTHEEWFEAATSTGDPPWRTVIFDESHHLRNHVGKMARMAVKVANDAERVYELTATPIWKEPDDLFMQLRILQPEHFTSYNEFVKLFCIADFTQFGPKVYGVKKEMQAELQEILDIMSLGRTYEQAGRELPPVIRNVHKLELPKDLRDAYDDLESTFKMELDGEFVQVHNFMQMLNALRQITGWPGKVEAAAELLNEGLAGDAGRVVCFTWYRDMAERAAQMLHGTLITGAQTAEERRLLARDKNNKVLCVNLAALSEGVDLSDVRTVVFLEEHWPPGSEIQALGRIQRERQGGRNDEPIKVHYMVVKNSIDEDVHGVQQRRSATIRDVLYSRFKL